MSLASSRTEPLAILASMSFPKLAPSLALFAPLARFASLALLAAACQSVAPSTGPSADPTREPSAVVDVVLHDGGTYMVDGSRCGAEDLPTQVVDAVVRLASEGRWDEGEVRFVATDPRRATFDDVLPAALGFSHAFSAVHRTAPESARAARFRVMDASWPMFDDHALEDPSPVHFEPFSLTGNEPDEDLERLFERTAGALVSVDVRHDVSVAAFARVLATMNDAGVTFVIASQVPVDGSPMRVEPYAGWEEPEEVEIEVLDERDEGTPR